VTILWFSSFEALLQRALSAWPAKAEDGAGEVTAPHELRVGAASPQASNPEPAELSRYFRDEHGRVHILL
jgi:hypothetical protein